jgi:hypothetical protein
MRRSSLQRWEDTALVLLLERLKQVLWFRLRLHGYGFGRLKLEMCGVLFGSCLGFEMYVLRKIVIDQMARLWAVQERVAILGEGRISAMQEM